jgi:hypothetical protein
LLEQFTNRVDVGAQGYGDGAVRLSHLTKKSRLFRGISDPSTILGAGSYYSVIADYRGNKAANVRVSKVGSTAAAGIGVAWSWRDRQSVELVLSSGAVTGRVGPGRGWTDDGERLMLNAVSWAASARR